MKTTKNFITAMTIGEFMRPEMAENEFADLMVKNSEEHFLRTGDSEIESWKANYKALRSLVGNAHLPEDAVIAFEYFVPTGGRIDCVLFGQDAAGKNNMVHIELKQWSNNNVKKYYGVGLSVIVDGYNGGRSSYASHPSAQAQEYQNHLLNYVRALEEDAIALHGFAYCYNYTSDSNSINEDNVLCSSDYDYATKVCPIFCKDKEKEFASKLKEILGGGKGEPILKMVDESEIGETTRLHEAIAKMFDNQEVKCQYWLLGGQMDAFVTILDTIKHAPKDEKCVIIVKGGPGTGKSVIALRLVSQLAKEGFRKVWYCTNATQFINGSKQLVKKILIDANEDFRAVDVMKHGRNLRPSLVGGESGLDACIIDEAHRLKNVASNHMSDRTRDVQTHLSQIMSTLFSARVCVYFIDDKQNVENGEIGNSVDLCEAAKNYYTRIAEENNAFRKKLDNGGGDERERQSGRKWLKDAIPSDVKVNVITLDLNEQFRCNGSNNYINWVNRIVYNEENNDVKLDKDRYEFEVLDAPQELYAKVRSLDSYACFADREIEKIQCDFKYKELQRRARQQKFTTRARLIAGWCWPWDKKAKLQANGDLPYEVVINKNLDPTLDKEFAMPWETKISFGRNNDFAYRYARNADNWANQNEGVNQIGCIYSMQGWETDYVGVIIGPDLQYDEKKGCLCFNQETPDGCEFNIGGSNFRVQDNLVKNIYRVLLTRGKKGCFVYACDPKVRDYIRKMMNE